MPLDPQAFYQPTAEPVVPEHTVQTKPEVGELSAPVDMKLLKRLDRFDEFIRKSQGLSKQGVLDYDDLCLFPNVQLSVGFKTPKFNKYDESLEGDALDWYSNLKPEEVKTWLDLSNAFIRQYEYNCELAPTRTTLEGTKRRPSEDHKTYAKRWRKIAAKVELPMTEDEIIRTFIKVHDPPYFEEIFRMTGCTFAAIVNKLEEYDDFVRAGKIVNVSALKSQVEALQEQGSSGKKPQFKKKEGEKLAREAEVFEVTDQPFVIEVPFEEDKRPFILDLTLAESKALEPVVIEFPEQEPVLSLQRVPWNYDEPAIQIGEKSVAKEEVSVVTRSGRIASPFGATVPIQTNNPALPAKPTITEKEALDFLKRLQRSEYNVVEKLSKSPAQISMLDLLFSSDMHRDALLEVLTKAQIPKDISVANFSHIVGSVLFTKQITFSDDELPAEGIGHNKALYIAVRCNGKILPKVLIDNGSALNICPWSTLEKLGLQDMKLRPSATIVRDFDGAQREPIGEVDLVVEMGPAQFQIACQVMHFPSVYNVLLGRPWIHKSGAVPSSLHQLLKFIVNDKLITIFAEEDCLVIADSGSKEDGSRNATVTPHSTADIVSVSWITKEE
ncbi:uncharacterized protein [Coffea arabica]|uniref:Retrotransposon gag domain-containing protein n=1 Tax=Coffea arabica TaxID=13443 RepID=A0ABM4WPW2_COFAR